MSDSAIIGLGATNSGALGSAARDLGASEGAGTFDGSGTDFCDFVEVVALVDGLLEGVGVALECVAESDLLFTGLLVAPFESA